MDGSIFILVFRFTPKGTIHQTWEKVLGTGGISVRGNSRDALADVPPRKHSFLSIAQNATRSVTMQGEIDEPHR